MNQTDKKCPNCGMNMGTDGRTYFCKGCGLEIPRIKHLKKPKKKSHQRIQEEQ
jgi:tRNA(Ile2) C34 agmatinyltransferase TiaS